MSIKQILGFTNIKIFHSVQLTADKYSWHSLQFSWYICCWNFRFGTVLHKLLVEKPSLSVSINLQEMRFSLRGVYQFIQLICEKIKSPTVTTLFFYHWHTHVERSEANIHDSQLMNLSFCNWFLVKSFLSMMIHQKASCWVHYKSHKGKHQ